MADEISLRRRSWVAFSTIVRKEYVRFMRIWSQTLLPPAMQMTLYFLVFGKVLAERFDDEGAYVTFLMPGLVMMSVITNAYANVVSSFFSAKFQRNVEEMLVSPTPNWVILSGYVAGGVGRGLIVGAVVMVIALLFTRPPIENVNFLVTLSVILLTAILFSIGGFLNALFAKKFDDVSIIPTFVLTPLTYLGGVFYEISRLDTFWQNASLANPIVYMVGTFRYGLLGDTEHLPTSLPVAYGIILAFIIVLFGVSLRLLNKGVGIRT